MSPSRNGSAAETLVRHFIDAFAKADLTEMAACLAEDVQSHITNAEGGVTLLPGRAAFMESIRALDVATVRPQVRITQILSIQPDQVMVMVEIKAERKGRKLHNFAAFLMEIESDAIATIHMVEALPAYSDSFWKD